MKVLIAGASGFIGNALIERLLEIENIEIVALSRKPKISNNPKIIWKQCDLFSLKDIQDAMKGCSHAYYLVHSMLPSADLMQGSFYDYDLILADNFARCARAEKLKRIIYLSGIIPEDEKVSWHLKSRLEVEHVLQSSNIPITTLRAGLIIGSGGSSLEIVRKLVMRLPVMVCPSWTRTKSQPIALVEMIDVLEQCLVKDSYEGKTYDVPGPEKITYQTLIRKTAKVLNLKRTLIPMKFVPLKLSRLWIMLITKNPKNLVYPLILSLKYPMVANSQSQWSDWLRPRISIEEALATALKDQNNSISFNDVYTKEANKSKKEVRSIQRIFHPEGKDAQWIANQYFQWLSKSFRFFIKVIIKDDVCTFALLSQSLKLLVLEKSVDRSSPDRQLLYIKGGLLASKNVGRARLEFREVLQGKVYLAAIHEYVPSLPWRIYKITQAKIHLWIMKRFNKYLINSYS